MVSQHSRAYQLRLLLRTLHAGRQELVAMQAVAAEDMDMKPRIAQTGAIAPLVSMIKSGTHPSLLCGMHITHYISLFIKRPRVPSSVDHLLPGG